MNSYKGEKLFNHARSNRKNPAHLKPPSVYVHAISFLRYSLLAKSRSHRVNIQPDCTILATVMTQTREKSRLMLEVIEKILHIVNFLASVCMLLVFCSLTEFHYDSRTPCWHRIGVVGLISSMITQFMLSFL